MGKINDLTHKRFGRLTVLKFRGVSGKNNEALWWCLCRCGKKKEVKASHLVNKNVQSCGCLSSELSSERYAKLNFTHGKSSSKVYQCWNSIKNRCLNVESQQWKNYGGRGIQLFEAWEIFECFYSYVSKLSNYGKPGYSLDRIDNDGDYEPGNVRWATAEQQNQNNRNCKLTREDVRKIRRLGSSGVSCDKLSNMFEISLRHARKILTKDTWKNV